jgi:N-acetylneuraminic acid mutarotase
LERRSSDAAITALETSRPVRIVAGMLAALLIAFAPAAHGEPARASVGAAKADAVFALARGMSTARAYHTATLLSDGRVLVTGGLSEGSTQNPGPPLASAEIYDPKTAVWNATGAMSSSRAGHRAMLLASGEVLVLGGSAVFAELYDPARGNWRAAAGPVQPHRAGFSATLLASGKVLVAGGFDPANYDPSGFVPAAEIYDPQTDSWTTTGALTTPRQGQDAVRLADGRVLITGGFTDFGDDFFAASPIAAAEVYDPTTGRWTAVASMRLDRSGASLTLLSDNSVLVAGGGAGLFSSASGQTEIYNQDGTWRAVGSMHSSRTGHTATLRTDGRVLAIGGLAASNFTQNNVTYLRQESVAPSDLYDPGAAVWTVAAALNVSRAYHTATLLGDGNILVTGGVNVRSHDVISPSTLTVLGSAEIYVASSPAPEGAFVVTGLFSDQAGLYQLIQLQELNGRDDQNHLAGTAFTVTSRSGVVKQFVFPSDLPSTSTARRGILIKTQSFQLPADYADFVMPDGFLPTDGGTIEASGPGGWRVSFPPLPADGHSLYRTAPGVLESYAVVQSFCCTFHVSIGTDPVIEYYNETLDHYFITASQPDIDALDSARTPGWRRTGRSFQAWISRYSDPDFLTPPPGLLDVCRIYIPASDGDSHFFSVAASECATALAQHPEFNLETPKAFLATLPDAQTGVCPAGQTPIYRVWNGRADSNHRYVDSLDIRNAMIARGYTAEGYGPDRVTLCVGGGA